MAAGAIIAGVTALAPTILNLITSLVHKAAPVAEVTYGPKSGPVKRADVLAAVKDALDRSAASGSIAAGLMPSDLVIGLIVDAVVASMNLSGQLSAPTVAPVPGAVGQAITLKAGQTLTISVV